MDHIVSARDGQVGKKGLRGRTEVAIGTERECIGKVAERTGSGAEAACPQIAAVVLFRSMVYAAALALPMEAAPKTAAAMSDFSFIFIPAKKRLMFQKNRTAQINYRQDISLSISYFYIIMQT